MREGEVEESKRREKEGVGGRDERGGRWGGEGKEKGAGRGERGVKGGGSEKGE